MNKNTYKKIIPRTIGKNYKQFLLSIFIVFFASMILCGFMVNAKSLSDFVSTYFETTNLADIILDVSEITEEDEQFFEQNNISYKKRLYFESSVSVEGSDIQANIEVFVGDGKKISIPYIESGSKGILIDKNAYENNGLTKNSDYLLFSFNYEVDGRVVEFDFEESFSGTMSFVEKATSDDSWAVFIDEERFLLMLNEKVTSLNLDTISEVPYNQILIDTDTLEETLLLIENYYNSSESVLTKITKQSEIDSVVLFQAEKSQAHMFVYVLPIFFILVAMLLIVMSTSELIRQETRKIGIQKAIGISDKNIISHYGLYGGLIGTVGSVFGMVFGILIIPNIMFTVYNSTYTMPYDFENLNVPWGWIILAILILIICSIVSSTISAIKILKKTPIECLKGNSFSKTKGTKKQKSKSNNCSLYFKLPLRQIRSNPLRTIFASLGVAGVFALMMASFGAYDSLSRANETGSYLILSEIKALLCLKIFSVIAAIITVVNIGILIINQKSKEIAILKLLGGKIISVWLSVLFEIVLIILCGLILGVGLSFALIILFLHVSGIQGISLYLSASSVLLPLLIFLISILIVAGFCIIKIIFSNATTEIKNAE